MTTALRGALRRLRGEILLKRDPADTAAAEEAYQTAIAIAKRQGARSYELLASLSLAKLYQSTARPDEAYAVLTPALEGFTPTPEMPEMPRRRRCSNACKAKGQSLERPSDRGLTEVGVPMSETRKLGI
jgi:hypothetical protein